MTSEQALADIFRQREDRSQEQHYISGKSHSAILRRRRPAPGRTQASEVETGALAQPTIVQNYSKHFISGQAPFRDLATSSAWTHSGKRVWNGSPCSAKSSFTVKINTINSFAKIMLFYWENLGARCVFLLRVFSRSPNWNSDDRRQFLPAAHPRHLQKSIVAKNAQRLKALKETCYSPMHFGILGRIRICCHSVDADHFAFKVGVWNHAASDKKTGGRTCDFNREELCLRSCVAQVETDFCPRFTKSFGTMLSGRRDGLDCTPPPRSAPSRPGAPSCPWSHPRTLPPGCGPPCAAHHLSLPGRQLSRSSMTALDP